MSGVLRGYDYMVFVCVFLVSAGVGIYHAMGGDRQRTANEYLLANRNMHPIPVSLSVAVSVISSVTYLGTPSETYIYGVGYWVTVLGKALPMYIITVAFCPIFYNLQITSIHEYLEMRFNKFVRFIGVSMNFIYLILYLSIVTYGPALALNAVTGLSLPGSIIAAGIVCTFYTTIGGIKAVMWTDVFQSCILAVGFLCTIFASTISVGGLTEVFRIGTEGGRTNFFDMRIDPTARLAFWNVWLGSSSLFLSYAGTNQIIVQRYLTCRSLKESQISAVCGLLLIACVEMTAIISGLCLYAYYAGCDPLSSGEISRADQLMPYSMIDLFGSIPGLAGLQVAAVSCASLSTVSSGINALSTLTGEDILKRHFKNMGDFTFTVLLKLCSLLYGTTIVVLAFVVSRFGGILSVTVSLIGVLNGPLLGVFCLGIFFPRSNSKGAIVGMLTAISIGLWIKICSFSYPKLDDKLPLSASECLVNSDTTSDPFEFMTDVGNFSLTFSQSQIVPESQGRIISLYQISYNLYGPLVVVITVVVGLLVSFITGPTNPASVKEDLVRPVNEVFCCCIPRRWRKLLSLSDHVKEADEVNIVKMRDVNST